MLMKLNRQCCFVENCFFAWTTQCAFLGLSSGQLSVEIAKKLQYDVRTMYIVNGRTSKSFFSENMDVKIFQ